MKKVILLGAFDRYNYGDNLMPILFELFLRKFYPGFFSRYQLVFSALINSDLSKYNVKKTVAMARVFEGSTEEIKAIICIGGEVLSSSSSTLFLHMNHSKRLIFSINLLKNIKMSFLADMLCRSFYKLPWEYPYLPKKISSSIKIGLNTIGGSLSWRRNGVCVYSIKKRLSDADYLSVRDKRTEASLKGGCKAEVFPDSAVTMAYLTGKEFLMERSGSRVNDLINNNYICFQAAPRKVGASAYECKELLKKLSESYGLAIKLCPIGYANGHNDIDFLREIERLSEGAFELVYDLNIWEIMSIISNSKIFIGTSLHGVITALSFSVPFIGLNRAVNKLDKFLSDWGVGISTRCYSISEVPDVFQTAMGIDMTVFRAHSQHLLELGLNNNHRLVRALCLDH